MISHGDLTEWFHRRKLAKPFLRWAGGKQPFLHRYGTRIPDFNGNYIEPFLGSGAIFFYIQRTQARPTSAILSDVNLQLILTFYAVRDEPKRVFDDLEELRTSYLCAPDRRQFFEDVRTRYNTALPGVDPATFIFLNRTCWNGLYRVNRSGSFNVPHGSNKGDPAFPDLADLLNASAGLRQAQLRAASWENTLGSCARGDFVFLDPPYYSESTTADTKYARVGSRHLFNIEQHKRLIRSLVELKKQNIEFMLTNSGENELVAMYEDAGFFVEKTLVPRYISSITAERTAASEVIVTPRPPLRIA